MYVMIGVMNNQRLLRRSIFHVATIAATIYTAAKIHKAEKAVDTSASEAEFEFMRMKPSTPHTAGMQLPAHSHRSLMA